MFGEKNRSKRLANEAKAINRKLRNKGELSGKDAARLSQVKGRIVKYGIEDTEDDSYDDRDY